MDILNLTNEFGHLFLELFSASGYKIVNGVGTSSKTDASVYLIGSTISVLKPYLLSENITVPKCVMLQKAIRTQGLKNMENAVLTNSIYGSFFIAMGTLAPYSNLEETISIAMSYIHMLLRNNEPIMLRVNSKDKDLFSICTQIQNQDIPVIIEKDTKPLQYYQHHYGLDEKGITGRNMNIAVNSGKNEWYDVANIIVIEKNEKPYAVEFAMGMSTLITHLFGLEHTMLGNPVAEIIDMKLLDDYWLGDCISVVACLQKEKVIPNSSKMQGRLLKRYIKVLERICEQKCMNMDELLDLYNEHISKIKLPI